MFSILCFEGSAFFTNILFVTVITFSFVYTCGCTFFMFGVVRGFVYGVSFEGVVCGVCCCIPNSLFYKWLCECFYIFSISCFEWSTCLANLKFGTIITFKFVYRCACVFFMFGVVRGFVWGCLMRDMFVLYAMLCSSFLFNF